MNTYDIMRRIADRKTPPPSHPLRTTVHGKASPVNGLQHTNLPERGPCQQQPRQGQRYIVSLGMPKTFLWPWVSYCSRYAAASTRVPACRKLPIEAVFTLGGHVLVLQSSCQYNVEISLTFSKMTSSYSM